MSLELCGSGQLGSQSRASSSSEREGRDVVAEVGRGWKGAEAPGAAQVAFPRLTLQFPDSPERAAEERRGGYGLQSRWVPVSCGRSVPPSLLPALPAGERAGARAEPGPGGLRRRLRGRRAGRTLGTCCTAAASPGRAGRPAASPHLPGPACVHVISLVVRAGVRPWVPSTLPPAPTPTSFLCLSLGSSASSRKPSESARACGNLFVVGRPHPLHSLQQASLARISQNNLHGVVYPPPPHFTENSEGGKFCQPRRSRLGSPELRKTAPKSMERP